MSGRHRLGNPHIYRRSGFGFLWRTPAGYAGPKVYRAPRWWFG